MLSDTGFDAGESFQAIYALSGDVFSAWDGALSADLNSFSETEREELDRTALLRVQDAWESRKAGAGDEAAALVEAADPDGSGQTWRLLYVSALMDGPKVPASVRREISNIPAAEVLKDIL